MEFNIKRSKIESENSDCYIALALLFNQVSVMAQNKIGGWTISECSTATELGYFLTSYSNGKMIVKCESENGDHVYSAFPVNKNDDK